MHFHATCILLCSTFTLITISKVSLTEGASLTGGDINSLPPKNDTKSKDPHSHKKKEEIAKQIKCNAQERVAMKDECYEFYACAGPGVPAKIMKCDDHKVFHHQMRACLKMPKEECEHSMCESHEDKFPDPYSKQNYLSCKHLYPEVTPCPEGQEYYRRKQICGPARGLEGMADSEEDEPDTATKKSSPKNWARMMEEDNEENPADTEVNEGREHNDEVPAISK